ncbi:MAG: hypothetical protein HY902_01225 [Deltaproteobacteria bacterium]|nr:hypothetical protein [Deltaproteobacteria bacterium]
MNIAAALRWLAAAAASTTVALGAGIALGLASSHLDLIGLYDVAAALALGTATVAWLHLLQLAPGRASLAVALLVTLVEVTAFEWTAAQSFAREQAEWLAASPELEVQDLAVAGVDTAQELVEAGLKADTGHGGVLGAWLARGKAGIVIQRGGGSLRVVPAPLPVRAAWLGARIAAILLVVWRSLRHLAQQPRCSRCGRYQLRRERLRLTGAQAAELANAWQRGERPEPAGAEQGAVAALWQDECPVGHSQLPGLAIIGLRQHGWARRTPGPWAQVPAQTDGNGQPV